MRLVDAGAQARLQALVSLVAHVAGDTAAPETAAAAHAALSAATGGAPPVSLQDAGRLLALERRHAYGIMAPSGDEARSAASWGNLDGADGALNSGQIQYFVYVLDALTSRAVLVGQEERRVRGGGIYPTASLLNHECLPNVARCESDAHLTQLQLQGRYM